jgi:hypothetical protein
VEVALGLLVVEQEGQLVLLFQPPVPWVEVVTAVAMGLEEVEDIMEVSLLFVIV